MRENRNSRIEERLARLEETLAEISERLMRLEELLASISSEARIAGRLVAAFSLPAASALEAARRLLSLGYLFQEDPIARTILEALATCEPLSISEITRRVRKLRGTASRRIIRERIKTLTAIGAVKQVDSHGKTLYTISTCVKGNKRQEH